MPVYSTGIFFALLILKQIFFCAHRLWNSIFMKFLLLAMTSLTR